jgi:hypothetical protein
MSKIQRDAHYPNLVWMIFDDKSWDGFHYLMDDFVAFNKETTEPIVLVFYPRVDMPKGAPLPHIRRMVKYLGEHPEVETMITVLPKWMKIAKLFANLSMKIFPNQTMKAILLDDVEKVYTHYCEFKEIPVPETAITLPDFD